MYGKFNVISIDFKMPTGKYIFLTSLECMGKTKNWGNFTYN